MHDWLLDTNSGAATIAHVVWDMNGQVPQVTVEVTGGGELQIIVEVSLLGSRATRVSGRKHVSAADAARLRELARGPYGEPVRCTAAALLAFHEGATLELAARIASRMGSWLWTVVKRVQISGADALITLQFKQSEGVFPRFPHR